MINYNFPSETCINNIMLLMHLVCVCKVNIFFLNNIVDVVVVVFIVNDVCIKGGLTSLEEGTYIYCWC